MNGDRDSEFPTPRTPTTTFPRGFRSLMNDEKIETLFGNVEEVSKDYIVDSIKQNYNKNNNSPKPWSIG